MKVRTPTSKGEEVKGIPNIYWILILAAVAWIFGMLKLLKLGG